MATAGPNFTGTGANHDDGAPTAWSDPTNIQGDTTSTAATSAPANNTNTQILRASNFGFSIPTGATIDGITVEWERSCAGGNSRIIDNSLRLLVAGSESGDDKSGGTGWSTTKAFVSYGGTDDTWGASLTPAIVNATGFGTSIKARRSSGAATSASVFRCRITVTYTEASASNDLTATGIVTGSPTTGTPAVSQAHTLTATGIATGTPTLGLPVLAEPPVVVVALSDHITGTEAATAQLAAPSGKTTSDFGGGYISENANPVTAVDLAADKYAEFEWSIKITKDGLYRFRVTDNGTALDAYDHYLQVTASEDTTVNSLTATGLATSAPTLGTPAVTQAHALTATATGIATGAPTAGTPALTQVHALTAVGLVTGSPTLGTPTLADFSGVNALTAVGLVTGEPTMGTPVISQVHAVTAVGIVTASPTTGTPAISQVHGVTAVGIVTASPTLGTPTLAQTHVATATGVETGEPTLGTPTLAEFSGVDTLTATGLVTGAPTTGTPAIAQTHSVTAQGIATGAPELGTPTIDGQIIGTVIASYIISAGQSALSASAGQNSITLEAASIGAAKL